MGISCFPIIPLGFSTNMNLFSKVGSIYHFPCCAQCFGHLRPLLGICIIIDETGCAMVILIP